MLYRLSRLKRRQEGLLNAQKEQSLQGEKRLVEEQLQRAKEDLSGFVDHLAEKNALIDTIAAPLEHLSQQPLESSTSQQLTEARQQLADSILLTNEDWEEFRRRFERVHPGFFWQMKDRFPDLNPAEERLLALSQLPIDTRQMSRMRGIAPDSIRKTKYRLLKRLGVDGASPLSELLASRIEQS